VFCINFVNFLFFNFVRFVFNSGFGFILHILSIHVNYGSYSSPWLRVRYASLNFVF